VGVGGPGAAVGRVELAGLAGAGDVAGDQQVHRVGADEVAAVHGDGAEPVDVGGGGERELLGRRHVRRGRGRGQRDVAEVEVGGDLGGGGPGQGADVALEDDVGRGAAGGHRGDAAEPDAAAAGLERQDDRPVGLAGVADDDGPPVGDRPAHAD